MYLLKIYIYDIYLRYIHGDIHIFTSDFIYVTQQHFLAGGVT